MKIIRTNLILVFLFSSTFLISFISVPLFFSPCSKPLVIGKGEKAALGECGDLILTVYGSNYYLNATKEGETILRIVPVESIYAKISIDGKIWSEPILIAEGNEILFWWYNIIRNGNGAMVVWNGVKTEYYETGTITKNMLYFVITDDCRNWSELRSIESFPFETDTIIASVDNYLLSMIKLQNGNYAALLEACSNKDDKPYSCTLYYTESSDFLNWSPRELVFGSSGSLLEEGNNIILVSDDYPSSTIYLSQRHNGIWTEPQFVTNATDPAINPSLFKVKSEEYWLIYRDQGEIYIMKSKNLKDWSSPAHVAGKSTKDYINNTPLLLKNRTVYLQFISSEGASDVSSMFDSEPKNEVKIRQYNPLSTMNMILLNFTLPLLFACILTGGTYYILNR